MARIVKKEEYEMRRNEILDAAQRLVYTKGYEPMSIQDILVELKISKGAFYHYYDSKQALLEALIERMASQIIQLLIPIVQDEHLPAHEKLHRLFDTASRWKTDRKEVMLKLIHTWYCDENVILRQKTQAAILPRITPLLSEVIRQGAREGVFHTPYPDQASQIIYSILQNFGDTLVNLLSQPEYNLVTLEFLDSLSASHQDAMERMLGAEPGSLPLFDTAILREWFTFPDTAKEKNYEHH